ncbi:hypothetical protein [Desulfitobacterium sp.]|uniref:hypothetical protein n=1 Tax=Desulfitobacterium sp. TaxID=49981 RepID=UPI002B6488F1|nr:hypothetical protein [Desulfitobacterium sp.]HVJ48710.1 hypothetical protein [Desulfitobacterium sp.]
MIIGAFLVYFLLFVFIFTSPEKLKRKDKRMKHLFFIPAIIALVMTSLTVLKVYFIYKILILLFTGFTLLLSYWQWGAQIKRWWES